MPSSGPRQMLLCVGAVVCFKLAYTYSVLSLPAMVAYCACVCLMTSATSRAAFYSGMVTGTVTAAIELTFFRDVFGPASIGLWLILGLWLGLFTLTATIVRRAFPTPGIWLLPVLWMGFEYFRGELYYLRFTWVTPGLSLVGGPWQSLLSIGVYGAGSVLILLGIVMVRRPRTGFAVLAGVCSLGFMAGEDEAAPDHQNPPLVAGIQLEYPDADSIALQLDEVRQKVPDCQLILLSEYTFNGPVPDHVLSWCDDNDVFVVVGGKEYESGGNFRNTVFVISPDGDIVHTQAKTVPIQFFNDGLPAEQQDVWESPWGPIGIAICYDLSYARVMDRLVSQGAMGILNPTMDPVDWGGYEHRLHSRIPRMRSIEYGIPIARLASSGLSPFVDAAGRVRAEGSFPGQGEIISYHMPLTDNGRLPIDRWLAMACVFATPVLLLASTFRNRRQIAPQRV